MELSPDEKQKIYEEEKYRIETQEEIKRERRIKKALLVIGFIAVIVFLIEFSSQANRTAVKDIPASEPTIQATTPKIIDKKPEAKKKPQTKETSELKQTCKNKLEQTRRIMIDVRNNYQKWLIDPVVWSGMTLPEKESILTGLSDCRKVVTGYTLIYIIDGHSGHELGEAGDLFGPKIHR